MKNFANIFFLVFSLFFITSCDKIGRAEYEAGMPGPKIEVLENNVPDNASLNATLRFQIIGGTPPYYIYPLNKYEVIDEAQGIYEFSLRPGLKRFVCTVMDSNFKSDTAGLFFPIPEILAKGLFRHTDGTIDTINYKFENFGTESNPNYMLSENVYSNIYSFGTNKPVEGAIAVSPGYEGKITYSRYTFQQAFDKKLEDYDQATDPFFNPPVGGNVYDRVFQGICPTNWHIPNNNEWLKLLVDIGVKVDNSPKANDGPGVFNNAYLGNPAQWALFESEFNTGYSLADGTYPTAQITGPGVPYFSSSMTPQLGQYYLNVRYMENKMSLEAWGEPGNQERYQYVGHIRCKFNY